MNCVDHEGRDVQLGKELNNEYFPHHPSNILRVNNGSFGACPNIILGRLQEYRDKWLQCPDTIWGGYISDRLEEARSLVAKDVAHCSASDIVIIENVTVASTMIANWLVDNILKVVINKKSMVVSQGPFVVLATNFNYNAVKASYAAAKMRLESYHIEVVIEIVAIPFPLESSTEVLEAYRRKLTELKNKYDQSKNPDAFRLVYLDHIISNPCMILPVKPIAKLCRDAGFDTIYCDGAHAPGNVVNLEVENMDCDFYASNLHKWLFAPTAAAFLYQNSKRHNELHHPIMSHNHGVHEDELTRYGRVGGLAGECRMNGTRDYSSMMCIPQAISFYRSIGGDAVAVRNRDLAIKVGEMLAKAWDTSVGIPIDMIGCMSMIGLPKVLGCTLKDAATLRNELLSMSIGVYTRIMTQFCYPADGRLWIRISVAAYNYQDEYEVLRDAINAIVTKRSAGQSNTASVL